MVSGMLVETSSSGVTRGPLNQEIPDQVGDDAARIGWAICPPICNAGCRWADCPPYACYFEVRASGRQKMRHYIPLSFFGYFVTLLLREVFLKNEMDVSLSMRWSEPFVSLKIELSWLFVSCAVTAVVVGVFKAAIVFLPKNITVLPKTYFALVLFLITIVWVLIIMFIKFRILDVT